MPAFGNYWTPFYWPGNTSGGLPAPTTGNDLMSAVVAQLRATPAILTAFGDSAATPKFWADDMINIGIAPPYMAYSEPEEDDGPYQSPDADGTVYSFPLGRFHLTVAAEAKLEARTLGRLIADTLNDAPLTFTNWAVLELRLTDQASGVAPAQGPGPARTIYLRSLTFTYRAQRAFPSFS